MSIRFLLLGLTVGPLLALSEKAIATSCSFAPIKDFVNSSDHVVDYKIIKQILSGGAPAHADSPPQSVITSAEVVHVYKGKISIGHKFEIREWADETLIYSRPLEGQRILGVLHESPNGDLKNTLCGRQYSADDYRLWFKTKGKRKGLSDYCALEIQLAYDIEEFRFGGFQLDNPECLHQKPAFDKKYPQKPNPIGQKK